MSKCSHCGKEYEPSRGVTFVKTDGTIFYFCSSKCRKTLLMGKRKVRWVLKSKKKDKKSD